jgi:hypothetical protein
MNLHSSADDIMRYKGHLQAQAGRERVRCDASVERGARRN